VALQKLPVIFCLDRAGLVGEDGATHHGVFDLSYLRCIPNMIIFAPRNELELRNIMYTSQLGLEYPIAIRYPRGRGVTLNWKQPFETIDIGKGVQLKKGKKTAILTIGTIAKNVSEAISGLNISHYDMRFLKPLDENLLHTIFENYSTVVTVEENTIKGGFGSAVLEFASDNNYKNHIKNLGIPDRFIEHGNVDELQQSISLDVVGLKKVFKSIL
jgi:1-deoxy-D-xylulose-5-phosphate synthase